MIGKRIRGSVVSEFPLDCWCVVIEFMNDKGDALSLFRAVGKLYDYVKRISPHCTKNVVFPLKRMPDETVVLHVTNVKCAIRKGVSLSAFLRKFHFSQALSLFNGILFKFPNLEKLDLSFCGRKRKKKKMKDYFNFKVLGRGVNSSLKILNLTFYKSEVTISQTFPNLQELYLLRRSKKIQDEVNLDIDFTKLPRVRVLTLNGRWRMKSNIFETKSLRKVSLRGGVIVPDTNIEKSESLQELFLSRNSTLKSFTSLHNQKLSKLIVVVSGSEGVNRFPFSFSDIPNLVELRIDANFKDITPVQITGKFLQNVSLASLRVMIEIFDTPSLKYLSILDSDKIIMFPNIERDGSSLEHLTIECFFSPPVLEFKKFHNLKELSVKYFCVNYSINVDNNDQFWENYLKSFESKSFPELEKLDIHSVETFGVEQVKDFQKLSSVRFSRVSSEFSMKNLPSLSTLIVDKADETGILNIFHLLHNHTVPNLQKLEVTFVKGIIDIFLCSDNLGGLKELNLDNFKDFDGDSSFSTNYIRKFRIKGISPNCPLERLNVMALSSSVKNLPKLKKFKVEFARSLKVRNCPELEELKIQKRNDYEEDEDDHEDKYVKSEIILEDLGSLKKLKIRGHLHSDPDQMDDELMDGRKDGNWRKFKFLTKNVNCDSKMEFSYF